MRDLELLDADLLGAAPDWARQLSPGASDHFNAKVSALYKEGKTPDQVDRLMATYGPSYFEDLARPKGGGAAPSRAVRAAGGAAMAAKGCGADGDAHAWALFCLCLALVLLAVFTARALRGGPEGPSR